MKYGILFSLVSLSLICSAILQGRWYYFLLWPAISFGVIAAGYFHLGPRVFGKHSSGVLKPACQLILLPYLVYSWSIWHVIRLVKTEPAYDQLNENVYVGRRLLGHELPPQCDHIIDLTCEFSEPFAIRSKPYYSFQIMDGHVPSIGNLCEWIAVADNLAGRIYIHCAEGHGRTGLFAAALLLYQRQFHDPDEAIHFIQTKRPLVQLSPQQAKLLKRFHRNLERK